MVEQFSRAKLDKALSMFRAYSKGSKFEEDTRERIERKEFFQRLAKEKFNELTLAEMIKKLWAAQIWGNKEYLINKIIRDNGMDNLVNKFNYLFSSKDTPGKRYDEFLKNIKGIGPSMLTEIFCHVDPENAGIWNDKTRKGLKLLETRNVPFDRYRITGQEYDHFNAILKILVDRLIKEGYKGVDLLFVDYFLWEALDIWTAEGTEIKPVSQAAVKTPSRHDELRDKVAEIGSGLGFEVETEKLIATGARVDVVWRAKIANLGTVSYIFEVQERGSIDSLMVNLQRAQTNPTVQKLIIVSDAEQITKIQDEIKTMPESFRKAATFWNSIDVENTHKNLEQVNACINRLGLVNE